jgi:hypothetical protein
VSESDLPEGVPGWFEDRDRNGDGQITMAEYADRWTDELVDEFFSWDTNGDGVITVSEARRGVESGLVASSGSSSGRASGRGDSMARSSDSTGRSFGSRRGGSDSRGDAGPRRDADSQRESDARDSSGDAAAGGGQTVEPDEKMIKYAETIIKRYDQNGDGALTASEWESMLMNPAPADLDRDGRVTVTEYATYLATQRQR